jgi:glycosyltransferase involved in cell wall biosynthesis
VHVILSALLYGSLALILYTYLLFPLIVLVRALARPKPFEQRDTEPSVTLIIAAHNEAGSIGDKLDNTMGLDYPADRLEVIVASDGSDDGTNEIVDQYADRVRLLALPRNGKASAMNAAIGEASGEVIVFSDANSTYAGDAIRALVRPFADPSVGGVAGNQRYRAIEQQRGNGAGGEQAYWSFDRLLKVAESRAGNAISATGAIYAIRRSLVGVVPDGVTDDFAVSSSIIAQGYRLVFAPDAVAYESPAASGGAEFGRKVRVITRGLRGVLVRRELLNPLRFGFYAVQLLSHKVLRRLMVIPLLLVAGTTGLLWSRGAIYRFAAIAQVVFYALAAIGIAFEGSQLARRRILAAPAYFVMVNAACLVAIWNLLRGRRIDRWDSPRASPRGERRTPSGT